MISFRTARLHDIPVMQEVMEQSIEERGTSHYNNDEIDALTQSHEERFFEAVLMGGSHVVIAEDGTQIVGFGGVNMANGVLSSLFVDPRYADEGIGTELVDRIEQEAVDFGCSELVIYASDNAVPFYQNAGYNVVRDEKFQTPDGRSVRCTFMRKEFRSD